MNDLETWQMEFAETWQIFYVQKDIRTTCTHLEHAVRGEAKHVLLVAAPQTLSQLLDDVLEIEGPQVLCYLGEMR